jgi:hypothetical protein
MADGMVQAGWLDGGAPDACLYVGGLLALHASMHFGLRYGWQQVPDFDATLACVQGHAGASSFRRC